MYRIFTFFGVLIITLLVACEPETDSLDSQDDPSNSNDGIVDQFQNSQNVDDGCEPCYLGDAYMPWDAYRAVLLFDGEEHAASGLRTYVFSTGGQIESCEEGLVNVRGTIQNKAYYNDRYYFDVWLSDPLTWEEWSEAGGTYSSQGSGIDVSNYFQNWIYYIIDPDRQSVLTGLDENEGKDFLITHKPSDYSRRIQVGEGANAFNDRNGLLGWFTYTELDGSNPRQGDFITSFLCSDFQEPGCVRSAEEWKEYSGINGTPDEISPLLPIVLGFEFDDTSDPIFVETNQDAYDILSREVYGNPSNPVTNMLAETLASILNRDRGADEFLVVGDILAGIFYAGDINYMDWEQLSERELQELIQTTRNLSDFNNGLTFPNSCNR